MPLFGHFVPSCLMSNCFLMWCLIENIFSQSSVANLPILYNQHDFDLCPESHPRAFECGGKCCKPDPNEEIPSWSGASCPGEVIDCSGLTCKSYEIDCTASILIQQTENEEFDGSYTQTDYSEANRPLYASDENCIWWYRAERHWWIGSCQNVGTKDGFAYLEQDFDCPDKFESIWRRRITNEALSLVNYLQTTAPSRPATARPGSASEHSRFLGSTSGVNVVKQNRRYRQSCTPKYIRGQFSCKILPKET
jgi:hypothetical protein